MAVTWHPILAATEPEPGRWVLVDEAGREYSEISFVRRGPEVGYRARMKDEPVGYYRTLRAACAAAHRAFIRSHGPNGASNGGTGYPAW